MKLGYRDRVILLVACVIIIFCIGIFLFIKPTWEKLNKNEEVLKTESEKWNIQLEQFNNITRMQDNINKKYEKGKELSTEFTPAMNSIEFDRFMQKFINTDTHLANGLDVKGGVTFMDEGVSSISYYTYTPRVLTYPLYELADMDGSLKTATQEKLKESDILSKLPSQSAGANRITLNLKTTRQDLMNLLETIHKYAEDNHDAMLVHSVSINDYTFGLEPGEVLEIPTEIEKDEDGNIKRAEFTVKTSEANYKPEDSTSTPASTPDTTTDTKKKDDSDKQRDTSMIGYSEVNIDYELYSMQEPTKPDVGPAYNSAIWDGDEWQSYVSTQSANG